MDTNVIAPVWLAPSRLLIAATAPKHRTIAPTDGQDMGTAGNSFAHNYNAAVGIAATRNAGRSAPPPRGRYR